MSNLKVMISEKEYQALLKDRQMLEYLRAAGVDNWDGYSFAMELARDEGFFDDED